MKNQKGRSDEVKFAHNLQYYRLARIEKNMEDEFGDEYRERVPMFIPFLIHQKPSHSRYRGTLLRALERWCVK